jgi:hypothetical protein
LPDFTSYVPPGVYVSDTSQPVVTPTNITTNIVTVVGPAQGYQTASDVVQVYWNSNTALTHRGIFTTAVTGPPAIGAPVVKNAAGVVLVYSVDYTWVIDTSGGGGAANAVTYIHRLGTVSVPSDPSPGGLIDGSYVTVTYNYADPSYYQPRLFNDPSQISQSYGAAVTSTVPVNPNASQVICPLTLAAQMAMANGASSVLCLATNPADGTQKSQFLAAYAKIAANYQAMLIVPLFVDGMAQGDTTAADAHTPTAVLALIQDIQAHCNTSAADGYGRMAFVGVATNYDSATKPYDVLAGNISSKRIVLAYPSQLNFYNAQLSQTTVVSGYYLAAAMAGALAGENANQGLTKKSLIGFNGFPATVAQQQTMTFKNSLSKAGVCVAEISRNGTLEVRHGVTTLMTALTSREINIVRSGDVLFELVQTGMDAAALIGQPIDADTTTKVKGALSGILEQAVNNRVIQAYGNLAVRQQALPGGDPSIIECQFAYAPSIPLNYITVTFAIDLTSGAFSTDATSGTDSAAA